MTMRHCPWTWRRCVPKSSEPEFLPAQGPRRQERDLKAISIRSARALVWAPLSRAASMIFAPSDIRDAELRMRLRLRSDDPFSFSSPPMMRRRPEEQRIDDKNGALQTSNARLRSGARISFLHIGRVVEKLRGVWRKALCPLCASFAVCAPGEPCAIG